MGEQEVVMLAFGRAFAAVVFLVFVVGCGGFRPPLPGFLYGTDDREFYALIGSEFDAYSLSDPLSSSSRRAEDERVLAVWRERGSDWEVYNYVAPRYRVYVVTDKSLEPDDVEVRLLTDERWRKNVVERIGEE